MRQASCKQNQPCQSSHLHTFPPSPSTECRCETQVKDEMVDHMFTHYFTHSSSLMPVHKRPNTDLASQIIYSPQNADTSVTLINRNHDLRMINTYPSAPYRDLDTQDTVVTMFSGDRRTANAPQCNDDEIAIDFNRGAEGEVDNLVGQPRILNLDALNAGNIASFAREHELADLILTLVHLVGGPEAVEGCTRLAATDHYYYNSQLRVPASLVCGTSDGDMCYELDRYGDQAKV